MAVLRMGYVHVRVTDLAEAKEHYANTLGLYLTKEEPGRAFFKGWDEWDHHSVVLEEGGVGAVKFGFKGSSTRPSWTPTSRGRRRPVTRFSG
jgi:catechol 2,3-dioxygenase